MFTIINLWYESVQFIRSTSFTSSHFHFVIFLEFINFSGLLFCMFLLKYEWEQKHQNNTVLQIDASSKNGVQQMANVYQMLKYV
ncbi:hypothetical protein DOY81_000870 [Sarcophaga bullata]|nr:hypothetical protein DOY81_000870 [Sarcophaga bullata]